MGLFNIFKKNKKEKNTFNLEKMLETKNKNYIFSNYVLFLEDILITIENILYNHRNKSIFQITQV